MAVIDPIAFANAEKAMERGASLQSLAASAAELVKLAHPKSLAGSNIDRGKLFQHLRRVSNRLAEEDALQNAVSGGRQHIVRVVVTEYVAFQIAPLDPPGDKVHILKRLLNDIETAGLYKETQTIATALAGNSSIYPQLRDRAEALLRSWGVARAVVAAPESVPPPKIEHKPRRNHNEPSYLRRHEVPGFLEGLTNMESTLASLKENMRRSLRYSDQPILDHAVDLAVSGADMPALAADVTEISRLLRDGKLEPSPAILMVAETLEASGSHYKEAIELYSAVAQVAQGTSFGERATDSILANVENMPAEEGGRWVRRIAEEAPYPTSRSRAASMLKSFNGPGQG